MNIAVLLHDFYFWAALVLFLLSAAGIFWILKSIQSGEEETEVVAAPAAESLGERIGRIEETLSKIEKRIAEQNPDQISEMTGQMKIIVQMLKTSGSAGSGGADPALQQKVDKIYQILSTLSRTETK